MAFTKLLLKTTACLIATVLFFKYNVLHASGSRLIKRSLLISSTTTNGDTSNSNVGFSPLLAFGDSTSDTGNAVQTSSVFQIASKPPYGETFFKNATGRFSDGRLMLDFLCQALNLPLLPPHLASGSGARSENFAVAGATALDNAALQSAAGVQSKTPDSLSVQVQWFTDDVSGSDLTHALVYFGEIGGNDYNYALAAQQDPKTLASNLVPLVIDEVSRALDQILASGVARVVVQGEFPMGCMAVYLAVKAGALLDSHGCVADISALSDTHNRLLKSAIEDAKQKHPGAEIVYFDTSAAYLHILDNAKDYGFTNTKDPCFLGALGSLLGGAAAGAPTSGGDVPQCSDPKSYMSWDGIHLTDAMYGAMVKLFMSNGDYASPFPNFLTSTR